MVVSRESEQERSCEHCGRPATPPDVLCADCLSAGETAAEEDEQAATEARRAVETQADETDASWPAGDT